MLDLRQLVNLKSGIGPFEEGPLHCVPTYLTILRAKVKKQNKTVSNCFEGWFQTVVMMKKGLCQEMCAETLGIVRTSPNNESVI